VPVIDAHVHLKHGDYEGTEYSPEVIVKTMDAVGIDKSVVFAMLTSTRRFIEMASEAARKFPDRLIPFAYALPNYERPVLPELREALAGGLFRGLKLHAWESQLGPHIVDPVMALAGDCGVPCLIDFNGYAPSAERLACDFPRTNLIIAHMGRYLTTDERLIDRFIDIAERHPNVYLDLNGVVTLWKIKDAVKRIGSHRLIWGSDGPHEAPDTAGYLQVELDKIRALRLSDEDTANVLCGTISRLCRL
jgi:uncharacterized protein